MHLETHCFLPPRKFKTIWEERYKSILQFWVQRYRPGANNDQECFPPERRVYSTLWKQIFIVLLRHFSINQSFMRCLRSVKKADIRTREVRKKASKAYLTSLKNHLFPGSCFIRFKLVNKEGRLEIHVQSWCTNMTDMANKIITSLFFLSFQYQKHVSSSVCQILTRLSCLAKFVRFSFVLSSIESLEKFTIHNWTKVNSKLKPKAQHIKTLLAQYL